MARKTAVAALLLLGIAACGASADPPPVVPAEPSAAPPPSAAASADAPAPASAAAVAPSASASEPPPEEIEYPFKHVDKIPDDCKEPSAVLTTAPTKMTWDYDWMWTRQALYANPQFAIVEGKPEKPMQVHLDMYEIPGGYALVGVCKDGATCNKLAAMYKSNVPTCSPKLHCGKVPMTGAPRRPKLVPDDGKWLPATVVGQCARLGVCLGVKHEQGSRNMGIDCQNAPAKFHVDCSQKASCDEVVACLHGAK